MGMFRLLEMHYGYGFVKIELRSVLKIDRLYRIIFCEYCELFSNKRYHEGKCSIMQVNDFHHFAHNSAVLII